MAIGGRSRGRKTRSGPGAPRAPRRETAGPALRTRVIWVLAGALAVAVPMGAVSLVRSDREAGDSDRAAAARAQVATEITREVDSALEPLGQIPAPRLLRVPAALLDALGAAQGDAAVVRAATIGEASITLIEDARSALAAIDVTATVRDRGLDQRFVVSLIDARARMLDGLELFGAAARLVAQASLMEGPSLESVLATARDIGEQAQDLFTEGHELLIEAQIAAGTYSGPLVPAGGLG